MNYFGEAVPACRFIFGVIFQTLSLWKTTNDLWFSFLSFETDNLLGCRPHRGSFTKSGWVKGRADYGARVFLLHSLTRLRLDVCLRLKTAGIYITQRRQPALLLEI